MEEDSLGRWRQAICAPLRACPEAFSQIHGEVGDIQLPARHDEGDAAP